MATDDWLAPYVPQIKKIEGFTPRAKWDYKQHSIGYGTRGQPGQSITPDQAEADLRRELASAAGHVDRFAPGLPTGHRAALTSLTFNSGPGWQSKGLGAAVKAGDWQTAAQRFSQYNKVTNPDGSMTVLPGLARRRATELSWMGQAMPASAAAPSIVPRLKDPGVRAQAAPIAPEMMPQVLPTDKSIDTARDMGMLYMTRKQQPVTQAGAAGWMQALANVANAWTGRQWMDQARADEGRKQAGGNAALQSLVGMISGRQTTGAGQPAQSAQPEAYTSAASDPVQRAPLPTAAPMDDTPIVPRLGAIAESAAPLRPQPSKIPQQAQPQPSAPAMPQQSAAAPTQQAGNRMSEEQYNQLQLQVLAHPSYQLLRPEQQKVLGILMDQAKPKQPNLKNVGDDVVDLSNPNNPRVVYSASKAPDKVKSYKFYVDDERAAGRQPKSFREWDLEGSKAGASQTVVDMKTESEFDKASAKAQVGRHEKIIEAGDSGRSFRGQMELLREHSRNIGNAGATAPLKEALGPYATALGIPIDKLDDIQAFTSIIEKVAPGMRAPGSGATSDIEYKGFLKSLPRLSATAEGREMVINQLAAISADAEKRAEISSAVLSREIDRKQADKMLKDLPDVMSHYRDYQKASKGKNPKVGTAPVAVQTPEEAMRLPSGTAIKLPDGTIGRVP